MCDFTGRACTRPTAACFCSRCDLVLGLEGMHLIGVEPGRRGGLEFTIESTPGPVACPECGVIAAGKGRKVLRLVDAPSGARPVVILWRKRRWRCQEAACPVGVFTEQNPAVAAPRSHLTRRALVWAVGQMRHENASIRGLCRQLLTSWGGLWRHIQRELEAAAADESRFKGVTTLGVDEHVWHHSSRKKYGPKELTGMVDLTRDAEGKTRARLLDLVPGRSGPVYKAWLSERGSDFTAGIKVATSDAFGGYKNAIDAELGDATAVLDAFHVVKLGFEAVSDVRRRVQQETLGHRGRKGDPLYGIRNILTSAPAKLTDKQWDRFQAAMAANPQAHEEVFIAWQTAQNLRSAYHRKNTKEGRKLAEAVLNSLKNHPIRELKRLGRTLTRWREPFLAYFDTNRANNGGSEAINGLIELARRVARGFTRQDNYRLRMLLIAGGLDTTLPTQN